MKSKKPEQKKPSELRKRAEEKLKTKITPPKVMSDKETQQLIHELHVHLEMQNDELRKSQAELEESRSKYSDLYDFAPVGYFTFDKNGLILEVNLTGAIELGIEKSGLINKPFRAYIVTKDRNIFDEHLHKVLNTKNRQTCEMRLKKINGSKFYAQLESIAVNDVKGNTLYRTSVSEITDRRQSEEALKESEQRYRNIYNTAPLAFVLWDRETRVTDWNNQAEQMFGWTREEIVGQNFFDYIIPESARIHVQEIAKLLLEGKLPSYSINENITKSGRIIVCEWNNSIIRDSRGNVVGVISLGLDITERKFMEEELKRLAVTDTLTGALNRTKFGEIIERETESVKRYNQRLSMILFDVDHFKKVNDRYGHNAGDYVLKNIADIVRENIRKIDYFVRWGGEEFVILSPETQLDEAYLLADRIRITIENTKFEHFGKITVSFGVTEFKEEDTVDSFIKRADDAMYEAKKKGRNRVEVSV
jgi:diguanylate cyclase (GGDEF)-like protein/PAS domain S-box-containing protein